MIQRYKVFAKLQTALDFETLVEGLICNCRIFKLKRSILMDDR